ncbi:hypothetical protein D3C86_1400600 [compost metagenome]
MATVELSPEILEALEPYMRTIKSDITGHIDPFEPTLAIAHLIKRQRNSEKTIASLMEQKAALLDVMYEVMLSTNKQNEVVNEGQFRQAIYELKQRYYEILR